MMRIEVEFTDGQQRVSQGNDECQKSQENAEDWKMHSRMQREIQRLCEWADCADSGGGNVKEEQLQCPGDDLLWYVLNGM
jgi:hypothetical protein